MYNILRFFIFLTLVLAFPSFIRLVNNLLDIWQLVKCKNSNINLLDELNRLSEEEFRRWCVAYLNKYKYYNLISFEKGNSKEGAILEKEGEKIYLQCYNHGRYREVSKESMINLLGVTEKLNIKKSIIITTDIIEENDYKVLQRLPQDFSLEIIDGKTFNLEYMSFAKTNYSIN